MITTIDATDPKIVTNVFLLDLATPVKVYKARNPNNTPIMPPIQIILTIKGKKVAIYSKALNLS